jgi:diadenosine tetraphosphate (Ap4A) HIT family hydrolase
VYVSAFELDARLQADTVPIGDWPLSRVLLMNDARYPWIILVPRRSGMREIHELSAQDQRQLLDESVRLGRVLKEIFGGDKLNVAALGNVVPQLHVHHVVRRVGDDAWPAPVWGRLPPRAYDNETLHQRLHLLRNALAPLHAGSR